MDRIGPNNLGIVLPRHTARGFVLHKFSISVVLDGPHLRSHRPGLERLYLTDPALGTPAVASFCASTALRRSPRCLIDSI